MVDGVIGRPREYTEEVRDAVLNLVESTSYRKTAELCGISLGMVQRIVADGGK